MYNAQSTDNKWKEADMLTDGIGKRQYKGKSNLQSEEDFDKKIKNSDPSLQNLLTPPKKSLQLYPTLKLQ